MRRILLTLTLLAGLLGQMDSAQAVQCFGQVPDLEWKNGQPISITLDNDIKLFQYKIVTQRNYHGENFTSIQSWTEGTKNMEVGKSPFLDVISGGYSWKYHLQYGATFTQEYTYRGKNCEERIVTVTNPINFHFKSQILVDPLDATSIMNLLINKDYAFDARWTTERENFKNSLINIRRWLAATKNDPIPVGDNVIESAFGDPWLAEHVKLAFEINGINLLNKTIFPDWPGVLTSEDDCLASKDAEGNIIHSGFKTGTFFTGNTEVCRLSVNFGTNDGKFIKFGDLFLKNTTASFVATQKKQIPNTSPVASSTKAPFAVPNSKLTILCVKGKLRKSISGYNPKCPAGYKKS